MKEIKQYVVLIDSHRKNGIMCPAHDMLYQRATKGRYRVAAKNEKEAQELVQKAIGFGSVHVYYEDKKQETKAPQKRKHRQNKRHS